MIDRDTERNASLQGIERELEGIRRLLEGLAPVIERMSAPAKLVELGPPERATIPGFGPIPDANPGPVHGIRSGSGLTWCCRRTPWELPRTDRLSAYVGEVTCPQAPASEYERGQAAAGKPYAPVPLDKSLDEQPPTDFDG